MKTIALTTIRGREITQPTAVSKTMVRQVLLSCGIAASVLYAVTDVWGGLRYDGYDFTSRAISELAAIGAPTRAFVMPLFLGYGVLVLLFATGLYREAGGTNRAPRTSGTLLMAYALIGFTGFTFFPMQQRGIGNVSTDLAHIVVTLALVLLLLFAMGFGAFALRERFCVYSLATIVIVIVFGALSTPYPDRMAAGLPTPWFGIIERIDVYAAMVWMAVLSSTLMRRSPIDSARSGVAAWR